MTMDTRQTRWCLRGVLALRTGNMWRLHHNLAIGLLFWAAVLVETDYVVQRFRQ